MNERKNEWIWHASVGGYLLIYFTPVINKNDRKCSQNGVFRQMLFRLFTLYHAFGAQFKNIYRYRV